MTRKSGGFAMLLNHSRRRLLPTAPVSPDRRQRHPPSPPPPPAAIRPAPPPPPPPPPTGPGGIPPTTTADESPEAASNDTSVPLGPDFANSSRFHSAPFQRRPVNRSTGPRFHACRAAARRRRVRSATPSQIAEEGCPSTMSAEVFASPLSPQAAHQGLVKTSALTTPQKPVRPLPLRASRWPDA